MYYLYTLITSQNPPPNVQHVCSLRNEKINHLILHIMNRDSCSKYTHDKT